MDVQTMPLVWLAIEEYIQDSGMDRDETWGSAIEMICDSHLFNIPLYVYDVSHDPQYWPWVWKELKSIT